MSLICLDDDDVPITCGNVVQESPVKSTYNADYTLKALGSSSYTYYFSGSWNPEVPKCIPGNSSYT